MAGRGARRDQLAIPADLREGSPDIRDPAQRFQRDIAGVADDDDALEPAGRAVVAAGLALVADPVVDDEVASLDVQLESVAVRHDAAAIHLDAPFRSSLPRREAGR